MKRNRIAVIGLLALLGLSALFCALAYAWGAAQSLARQRQLARLEQLRQEEKTLAAQRLEHAAWKRAGTEYAAFVDRYLIPRDAFSTIRKRLNELLEANLLSTGSLGFETTAVAGGLQKVVIRFTVSGGYGNIKKLVYNLSTLEQMTVLNRLELSSTNRMVTAFFQLEAYLE
jgi:hypothetical protein